MKILINLIISHNSNIIITINQINILIKIVSKIKILKVRDKIIIIIKMKRKIIKIRRKIIKLRIKIIIIKTAKKYFINKNRNKLIKNNMEINDLIMNLAQNKSLKNKKK
jgi:hypothetical protein